MVATFRRGSTWAVLGLLCASALVVLLALRLRSARADYAALQRQQWVLAKGMYVPRLDLDLVSGGRATVGAPRAGSWQIILLYHTTCSFCVRSLPAWQELARRATALGVQVYGLSPDSLNATRRFVADHQLGFPTALLTDPRSRGLWRADAAPQTILIDVEGRVLHARPGTLSQPGADSVVAAIRLLEESERSR